MSDSRNKAIMVEDVILYLRLRSTSLGVDNEDDNNSSSTGGAAADAESDALPFSFFNPKVTRILIPTPLFTPAD
eukprot:13692404-Ditylum_brightwellii.AAC.1